MNTATYCPEDNKLRLYVGRVPRDEYEALRAEGWTSTPKQACDFVATWTPERRDRCLLYAEMIEDEDQTPEERAADRAERFAGYRENRLADATGHADRFDAGPAVHGYQSAGRAMRAADRHDKVAGRAVDAWDKAEYWQRRTAGVISHALHKAEPHVRMGRIKVLEAEQRKHAASLAEYAALWADFQKLAAIADPEKQTATVKAYLGARNVWSRYAHPRAATHPNAYRRENRLSLYDLVTDPADPLTGAEVVALFFSNHSEPVTEDDWTRHFANRLAYENQMLEAQGGRAGVVEMIPGGWLISGRPGYRRFRDGTEERRIVKVNKSPVSGRVVSVLVRDNHPSRSNQWGNPWPDGVAKVLCHTVDVERAGPDCYRPPTPEELAEFEASEKAAKKARKATAPAPIPLINPTDADAERLQAALNAAALADHCARHKKAYGRDYADQFKPSTVCRITQAVYSAASRGSFARAETRGVHSAAELSPRHSDMYSSRAEAEAKRRGPALCEVRTTDGDGSSYGARRVIVLTDKPQKPLPAAIWSPVAPAAPATPAPVTTPAPVAALPALVLA